MDSNSTLAPDQHSSSRMQERCCAEEGHFSMATYNENHSESDHSIACPVFLRAWLRLDSQIAALPEREEEQRPISFSLQEWVLFRDSLFASGAKSEPGNPWVAVGAVTLLSLLLLALVVIPLFHTDPLPKRETLTMLLVPQPVAASAVTAFRTPTPTYTSKSITTPTAIQITQEPPQPPVDTSVGVVGGVPGGLVGGVPGGVLTEVLSDTHGMPVFTTTLPAPK